MARAFADLEQEIRALGRKDRVRLLRTLLEGVQALPDAMSPRVVRADIEIDLAAANDYVVRHGSFVEMAREYYASGRDSMVECDIPAATEAACKDE